MDPTSILRNAFRTTWRYRALWIFGAALALVTSSWPAYSLLDNDNDWEWQGISVTQMPGETFWQAFHRAIGLANQALGEAIAETLGIRMHVNVLVLAASLLGIITVAIVIANIVRYVSQTALIRMVGTDQQKDERLTVRQGLRAGWSRQAWHLFLIDVLVDVAATVVCLALFAAIFAPLPLWVNGGEGVIFTFAFLTGSLFLAGIAVVIIAAIVISVLKRLAHQACVLEGVGVTAAIGRGWKVLRRHLRDTGLIWLITAGVDLSWIFLLMPVVLMLISVGLLVGGLPGIALGALAGHFANEETAVAVGLILGVPLFLLILVAPIAFLDGLKEVFLSALWTLTYHELQGLEGAEATPVPVRGPSSLEAAPAD